VVTDRDLRPAVAAAIQPYRDLLRSFAAGHVSADHFETEYLGIYLNDTSDCSYEVFKVVDGFFAEVDAYVGDAALRAKTSDGIGPEELRDRAVELLRRAGYEA
jgi:hypothetical protein